MRATAKGVALVAAALCGALAAVALRGSPSPAAPNPPATATATVRLTNLATTVLTQGTLGFTPSPPVVNRITGTYTSVLAPGTVVQPGQVLFRVDNEPVVLMSGTVPAWRPFGPGMTDGPDVRELETNLIALGEARGLLVAASPHYGAAAVSAVERWQSALGETPSGSIDLGAIVFLPAACRINAASVASGQQASSGDMPYAVTTTTRSVSVPLTPDDPTVSVGQSVSIQLPSGSTTGGQVTAIGPPAPTSTGNSQSSVRADSGSGSGSGSLVERPDRDPSQPGCDG